MMKRLLAIVVPCLLAVTVMLLARERADAISNDEDVVRNLNELFKAPTTFPPNNASRPIPDGARIIGNEKERAPLSLSLDLGPGEEEAPETIPARAYPFIAAIGEGERSPQQGYVCAGALIAPGWVLTAAHCTFSWARRWPMDLEPYVLFNTTKLSEPGPKFVVTKVISHPDYDARTLKNDLALLRIDTKGAAAGTPIKLEGPPIMEQQGEIAHILGWGVTNPNLLQRQTGEGLQLIQAVVRGEACFSTGNFPRLRGTGVFCASSLFRFHDTCYRFGGGPIVLRDAKGESYLGGLVSWSAVCPPETDKMNAYLDVQRFVPWIKSVIAANGGSQ